jgi:hypothetical protein
MKTRISIMATAFLFLSLAGCIPSIHPLYTSNDIVFNPLLVGDWFEKDNSNRWKFESSGDSIYKLTYFENGVFGNDSIETRSEFDVHLVSLAGNYFIDLYPGDNSHIPISGLLSSTLLPVHTFAKLVFNDGEFEIRFFSNEWLKQSILDKKLNIAYEKTNDLIVLTAPTRDLQEMVLRNVDNPGAFIEPKTLTKSKE